MERERHPRREAHKDKKKDKKKRKRRKKQRSESKQRKSATIPSGAKHSKMKREKERKYNSIRILALTETFKMVYKEDEMVQAVNCTAHGKRNLYIMINT
jgi:hypothetical protein